jgi:hypothetical protein
MYCLKAVTIAICAFVALVGPAFSATIEIRQDLKPYVYSLRQTYVPETSVEIEQSKTDQTKPFPQHTTIIKLSGIIQKGDADKLLKVIASVDGYIEGIVFDSPGGNFLEGIKIGEMLQSNLGSQDPSLGGVYVLKGERCLSACALAFSLSEAIRFIGNSNAGSRHIEDGALVGFHMGTLSESQAVQTANVKSIMDLTYSIVAAYSKLIKGNLNPAILLEEALKHRDADSFFYLRGGQRSLSMGFTPVTRSVMAKPLYSYAMNMNNVDVICRTLIMSTRIPKTLVTYDYLFINGDGPSDAETSVEDMVQLRGSRTLAGFMASGETCYITLREDRTILISITNSGEQRSCNAVDKNDYNTEAWCASKRHGQGLMTVGLLADTALCNFGDLQTEFKWWATDFFDFYGDETFKDVSGWKRTILRDVNMRQNPSLKAGIVAGLTSGEEVQVTDCRLVDDAQGVWYQIESKSRKGWISARFALAQLAEARAQIVP